jgi:membrane protein DedA with SNARE-associated domain
MNWKEFLPTDFLGALIRFFCLMIGIMLLGFCITSNHWTVGLPTLVGAVFFFLLTIFGHKLFEL